MLGSDGIVMGVPWKGWDEGRWKVDMALSLVAEVLEFLTERKWQKEETTMRAWGSGERSPQDPGECWYE